MTPNFRVAIVGLAALCMAIFGLLLEAHAAGWVVAPGKPMTVCEPPPPPEVKLGPNGVEYAYATPKCRLVQTGKAPLYHLDGRTLIPAQQSVAEGSPCLRTISIDHFVYGQTKDGGSLWALCTR